MRPANWNSAQANDKCNEIKAALRKDHPEWDCATLNDAMVVEWQEFCATDPPPPKKKADAVAEPAPETKKKGMFRNH